MVSVNQQVFFAVITSFFWSITITALKLLVWLCVSRAALPAGHTTTLLCMFVMLGVAKFWASQLGYPWVTCAISRAATRQPTLSTSRTTWKVAFWPSLNFSLNLTDIRHPTGSYTAILV